MTSFLNAAQIVRLSRAARQGLAIEVLATTPSTNADLRTRVAGLSEPLLLAAETQTAGRGRAGRRWHSAPGDSLCFSLGWRFSGPVARLSGLSLAVGVAVADALQAGGWAVQLKWPNDLLLDGAKLGGILIETVNAAPAVDAGTVRPLWAVIGIGLNLRPNAGRDAALDQPAASLYPLLAADAAVSAADAAPDHDALLAALADALSAALPVFDRDGLTPFVARWQALHAHQDCPVTLTENGQLLQAGIARGIDDSGRLLLDTDEGRIAIIAGDISLRRTDGALHAAAG